MTWRERAEKLLIGISGMPGVGKTTLVLRVLELARSKYRCCGFVTVEVRELGVRIGFDTIDVVSGARVPLARVGTGSPSVGKYVVNLASCEVISRALRQEDCEVTFIDEIGAMEFKCPTFYTDLRVAVDRIPRIIATVHRNYIHTAEKLGFEIIWLTRENWNSTLSTVLKALSLYNT